MTSRPDFTTPEWQTLQTAVISTIYYLTLSDPNFIEDFVDKHIANKALDQYKDQTQSVFINDLVNLKHYKWQIPKYGRQDASALEPTVVQSINEAITKLNQHDQTVLPLFKNLILALAHKIAVYNNASTQENYHYNKIVEIFNNNELTKNDELYTAKLLCFQLN